MAVMSTQAAELDWRFVSGLSSSMAAASGSNALSPGGDRPSVSPSPSDLDKASRPEPQNSASARSIVLLVEDNPTDILVISEVLKGCGLHSSLRIARDGQTAVKYLRDVMADNAAPCPMLVLLDLNIPKISGIEVLRELRAGSRCNRTPVIIVTSSSAETDRAAARELGADAYFRKPVDLAAYMELANLIRAVIGNSSGA